MSTESRLFIPARTPDTRTARWDLTGDERTLVTDFDGTLFELRRVEADAIAVRYFGVKVSKSSGKYLTTSEWEIYGPMLYPRKETTT